MNKDYMQDLNDPVELISSKTKSVYQELYQLGTPKQRLMAVLGKDDDIKTWFSERLADIISYRKNTLDKMSKFYKEVINPYENIRNTLETDNDAYKTLEGI